jgi:hypothetical protein
MNSELGEDRSQVTLDRALGEEETTCDFRVRQPVYKERKRLLLTVRERGPHHRRSHNRRHHDLAHAHRAYGWPDGPVEVAFEHETVSACLKRFVYTVRTGGAHDNDACIRDARLGRVYGGHLLSSTRHRGDHHGLDSAVLRLEPIAGRRLTRYEVTVSSKCSHHALAHNFIACNDSD